jgi:hypothetical protein
LWTPALHARRSHADRLVVVLLGAVLELLGRPAGAQTDRCLKGFYDPRNGGECWECPAGFARTVFPVDGDQACEKVVRAKATFLDRSVVAKETTSAATWWGRFTCEGKYPGSFHDPRNGGECWSCPSGFGRTVFAVTAGNACEKGGPFGQHAKATYKGKPGCAAGAFRNGLLDQCYSCPEGFKRSAKTGNDLTKIPDACVR